MLPSVDAWHRLQAPAMQLVCTAAFMHIWQRVQGRTACDHLRLPTGDYCVSSIIPRPHHHFGIASIIAVRGIVH